ncbi:MAG TPA: nucleotidyltransferase family protein [Gemmatimonadales bacterium]|nr:nucleotidyltransferase family protein [Gemmatimonadales bacterium]
MRSEIAGVILAAGSSSRLGTNKLLVELDGEALVRRAARRALAAGLDPLIVVLGFEADRVEAALTGLPLVTVVNPRHAEGMPTSLQAGLRAIPERCDAAVVLLPDMPLVTSEMLAELADRFRATGAPLVISLYGEVAAPPTLYARALFPALLAAGEGGRQVVREHRARAAEVRRPAELLVDLDLPADLERARAPGGR